MVGDYKQEKNTAQDLDERQRASYDLAIAYRICPKIAKVAQPLPFGDDKVHQAEVCLRSLRQSLGELRVKIWAILDDCPSEYEALFERHFAANDLIIVRVNGIGNRATYAKQMEILLAQQDADCVYFAEDDYLYLPNQFPLMLDFLVNFKDADFVTPYDHLDCYRLDLHREPKWLTVFGGHHWRTAASTCLTFLTRKATLAKYENVFKTYARRNDDCALLLSLTKRQVLNPLALFRFLLKREFYWKSLAKTWIFCWRQIVFGKRAKLWAPVPGVATHLSIDLLSPGVDWISLMRRESKILAEHEEAVAGPRPANP